MKYIYPLLIALAFTTSSFGQDKEENMSKRQEKIESRIESKKIAYITQKLDLSPEEAQLFWPIYNEYQAKMKALRNQSKRNLKMGEISEVDASAFLEKLLNLEQKELDIKKDYFNKMSSTISANKVAKLYILEKKFRKEILQSIKNRIGKRKRKAKMGN